MLCIFWKNAPFFQKQVRISTYSLAVSSNRFNTNWVVCPNSIRCNSTLSYEYYLRSEAIQHLRWLVKLSLFQVVLSHCVLFSPFFILSFVLCAFYLFHSVCTWMPAATVIPIFVKVKIKENKLFCNFQTQERIRIETTTKCGQNAFFCFVVRRLHTVHNFFSLLFLLSRCTRGIVVNFNVLF